jgi:hypothetical protein
VADRIWKLAEREGPAPRMPKNQSND